MTSRTADGQQQQQLLAVLPQEVLETDDRADRPFLRLPHPRNGQPSLYLPHKSANARRDGLLEVQRISPNAKRSWFLDQQVISDGSLLAFTPIDPLFLVIPLLVSLLARGGKPNEPRNERPFTATLALEQASGDGVRTDRFRPLDDLVLEASRAREYRLPEAFARAGKKGEEEEEEDGSQEEGEWMGSRDLVELCRLDCVRARISHACETKSINSSDVDAAAEDATVYRPSPARILALLRTKTTALAAPRTFAGFPSLVAQILRGGLDEAVLDAYQDALEGDEKGGGKAKVAEQARVRVACELVGGYLPPEVFQCLVSSFDFSALEDHLEAQAAIAFAASHTVSNKSNGPTGDASAAATKPGVKRKGSGQGSRGVEKLKKVNTSKMPKLTSFFTKKPKE